MKFEDFTKDQQKAIITKDSNIIVSAGAGSGKTAVLSQRVLNFVEKEKYHLNEFLILTFTKLAAGEMKERIRKELTEKGLEDVSIVDVCDITTFDAFALSIVKKYHNLLNVSPNVSIIDSNIISVKKRKIIEEIFEEYYTKNNKTFTNMIKRFCFKDDDVLRDLVLKLHTRASLELDFNEYLNNFINQYYNDEIIDEYFYFYQNLMNENRNKLFDFINFLPDVELSKKDPRLYKEVVEELVYDYLHAIEYDEFVSSIENIEENFPDKPRGLDQEIKDAIDKFKKILMDNINEIKSLPKSKVDFFAYFKDLLPYISLLIEFSKEVEIRIKKYKDSLSIYEFQDIAKMALDLFKNYPDVKNEVKNKLKMIMIDEYQDTSLIQETFIEQIASNNVYMVGDIKQSIYRFRNAKSDIFKDKYSKYKDNNNGITIDLNKNFRSRAEVLSDINFFFKQIMTLDMGGADYLNSHIIQFGNKKYETNGATNQNQHSSFLLYPKDVKFNKTGEVIEAEIIAQDILNKVNSNYKVYDKDNETTRNCDFKDFCIIMDRGSDFDDYVKVFNKYHIPLFVENDENISSNDTVKVLTNMLKLIKAIQSNTYDREFIHAFLSLSRSFIYKYDDETLYKISKNNSYRDDEIVKSFKEIIFKNKDLSTYELFLKIIFDLNIYNSFISIGDIKKNESYLDMFLDNFKQMSEIDYSIDDFILYLKHIDEYNLKINLPNGGESINSVTLMNIHKSKGLEFPIIYFSGLYKSFNRQELKNDYGVSEKYGLYFSPKEKGKKNIIKEFNSMYEEWEDTSEKIRLFYVALTRTKEKMIFLIPSGTYDKEKYLENRNKVIDIIKSYNGADTNDILENEFNKFKESKISFDLFTLLAKMLKFSLPLHFIDDSIDVEDKRNLSWNMVLALKDEEESIVNKVKEMISTFLLDDSIEEELLNLIYDNALEDLFDLDILHSNLKEKSEEEVWDLLYVNFNRVKNPTIEELFELLNDNVISYNTFIDKAKELVGDLSYYFYNNVIEDLVWDERFINTCTFNEKELTSMLIKFFASIKDNPINYDLLKLLISMMGYNFNEIAFQDYINTEPQLMNIFILCNIFNIEVDESYIPEEETDDEDEDINNYINALMNQLMDQYNFKEEKYLRKTIFDFLFDKYKNKELNLEEFINVITSFDVDIHPFFLALNDEEKMNVIDVDEIIEDKVEVIPSIENCKCLLDFISPFINYRKCERVLVDLDISISNDNILDDNIRESYDIRKLNVDSMEVYMNSASKKININAIKENITFGTNIHFIMEVMDFINPDYSIIESSYYRDIVKKFINSSLMSNIKNGEIYKEYEFIDEVNNIRGIIDLMVVYDSYIDIIDYKTKNIDDEAYDKQLHVYKKYIESKFNKPTNIYLYSLLTGDSKKID